MPHIIIAKNVKLVITKNPLKL